MDVAACVNTGEGQKVELTELVIPGLEAVLGYRRYLSGLLLGQ